MAKKVAKKKSTAKKVAKKTSGFVKAKAAANGKKTVDAKTGAVKMGTRKDLGQPGNVAIDRMAEPHRSIARAADATIRRVVSDSTSVVKWGNCCYFRDGTAFATIYETSRGVNLGIPGVGVKDPDGLLEGTGKSMRHVKLHDVALAKSPAVAALVKQAVEIGFSRM